MSRYEAGAVWYGAMQFDRDAEERKKYFVLVYDCEDSEESLLYLITTSRGETRYGWHAKSGSPCGCPDHSYFRIEPREEKCFSKTTWVEFDNKGWITREKLDEFANGGIIKFIQNLSPERTRSLLKCAIKSEDIENREQKRIERALKARNPNTPSAVAKPPADPKLAAARVRRSQYCGNCRSALDGALEIDTPDVDAILQGKKTVPDGFLADIMVGFELVSGCGTGSCPK